jgi:hypothetical protein
LTRPSGLSTRTQDNSNLPTDIHKTPDKKKRKRRRRRVYVPDHALSIAFGHKHNDRKKGLCNCLRILSEKDANWITSCVNSVRNHIESQVSGEYGSDDHLSFMRELLRGSITYCAYLLCCLLHFFCD